MKIDQFNRTNLKDVRDIITTALNDAVSELGLTVKIGNISFTDADFNTKLTVSCGSNSDAAKREWDLYAPRYGLTSSQFGKTFVANGKVFTITGIKPTRPKYPVSAKDSKGKGFKFPASAVK